ncbi:diadenosine tetraphosphate asymmetrical hydrolase [Vararia minispora EC-137]|uniref:Diadenosine tetraphosphate asymmetrical hydrolase n=1 Tax=Vararia minispora EC-137 TaxID=1314806 RepID=A0ACB8QJY3_9AGAM|nr:diadenosine tetraphosphate asymmetrical hydrolase [Vararia minispora EC-137]
MSVLFSAIEVSRQVFHRTTLTFAIVNLKPIVPGHVLVCPTRPAPRLKDLNVDELSELMISVNRVGSVLERAYAADGLTVACQDGKAAGQSVPHVHFHILPRKLSGDRFSGARNDDIYPALEVHEGELGAVAKNAKADQMSGEANVVHEPLKMDADAERKPRSMEEMEREATWLRGFFEGP